MALVLGESTLPAWRTWAPPLGPLRLRGWQLSFASWAVPTDSLVCAPRGQSPAARLPSAKGTAPDCGLPSRVRPGQGCEAAPRSMEQGQTHSQPFLAFCVT